MEFEHPAIVAWHKLHNDNTYPEKLEILRGENPTSTVFRLIWAEKVNPAVIAKRCLRQTALIESIIYEEILPDLPLPMVNYYGRVDEEESEFCWLFIQDAGGERYRSSIKEHRVAAARWLGIMNTSAISIAAICRLPEREPRQYLEMLRSACNTLRSSLTNPGLNTENVRLLDSIVNHCEQVAENWGYFEDICDGMPRTLVHGDFIKKNVAVHSSKDGIIFLPFDWEKAGRGVPAEDLSSVDISVYWLTVRDYWPGMNLISLKQFGEIGKVFRWLVFLAWIAQGIMSESPEQYMQYLRSYRSWLINDLNEASQW